MTAMRVAGETAFKLSILVCLGTYLPHRANKLLKDRVGRGRHVVLAGKMLGFS